MGVRLPPSALALMSAADDDAPRAAPATALSGAPPGERSHDASHRTCRDSAFDGSAARA